MKKDLNDHPPDAGRFYEGLRHSKEYFGKPIETQTAKRRYLKQ